MSMVSKAERIEDVLFGVAVMGGTISYGRLSARLGMRADHMARPLALVQVRAAERDDPLWSCLVVKKGTGMPGPGFYSQARKVRHPEQRTDEEILFRERNKCYEGVSR